MAIYVLMAVFWSVLGGALLGWQILDPDARFLGSFRPAAPAGVLSIVLALYNLIRLWSARKLERDRRLLAEAAAKRAHEKPSVAPPSQAPDPTFDFGPHQPKRGGHR